VQTRAQAREIKMLRRAGVGTTEPELLLIRLRSYHVH
jgi:hypothetical protein